MNIRCVIYYGRIRAPTFASEEILNYNETRKNLGPDNQKFTIDLIDAELQKWDHLNTILLSVEEDLAIKDLALFNSYVEIAISLGYGIEELGYVFLGPLVRRSDYIINNLHLNQVRTSIWHNSKVKFHQTRRRIDGLKEAGFDPRRMRDLFCEYGYNFFKVTDYTIEAYFQWITERPNEYYMKQFKAWEKAAQDGYTLDANAPLKLDETGSRESGASHSLEQVPLQGNTIRQGSAERVEPLQATLQEEPSKASNADDKDRSKALEDAITDKVTEGEMVETVCEQDEEDGSDMSDDPDTAKEGHSLDNESDASADDIVQDATMEGHSSDNGRDALGDDSEQDTAMEARSSDNFESDASEDDSGLDTAMELPSSDNEGNVSQHNAEHIYSSDNGSEAEEEDMDENGDELEEMPVSNTFLEDILWR